MFDKVQKQSSTLSCDSSYRSKLGCAFVCLIFVPGFSMDIKIKEINIQIFLTTAIFVIFLFLCFLSHLLIAGCDIGVQISVRSFVRPSVNIYVEV